MNFIVNLLILLPARIASYFSWAGPLLMRLIVGYTFMLTGWGKLTNLAQVTENFVGWGIPFPKILGRPEQFADLALHIVENRYLNGEVIRLDGAIRLAPR